MDENTRTMLCILLVIAIYLLVWWQIHRVRKAEARYYMREPYATFTAPDPAPQHDTPDWLPCTNLACSGYCHPAKCALHRSTRHARMT